MRSATCNAWFVCATDQTFVPASAASTFPSFSSTVTRFSWADTTGGEASNTRAQTNEKCAFQSFARHGQLHQALESDKWIVGRRIKRVNWWIAGLLVGVGPVVRQVIHSFA